MSRRTWGACGLVAAALTFGASPAFGDANDLNAYRVEATAKNLQALNKAGFDVTEGRDRDKGYVDVVGTPGQIAKTKVEAKKMSHERRAAKVSVQAATDTADDSSYNVWTKYDAVPDDDKEQFTEQYDRVVEEHPDLAAKRVWGQTYGGRDIIGIQVTKGATGKDIPGRPAVLYNAQQHAREWLAGETCRRTLDYFLDNYGKTTSAGLEVTPLVDNNELWFVCINNPDGFEYTFTPGNRLWRKNLRDNNNNGTIEVGDGVDPNRNFAGHWGLDDEGSSPDPASDTYRGPSAASEPETKAMEALFGEIHPVFQKNDHTAAELLLYPQGFQQDTPTADNEIFAALAGDPFKPGIEGFLPELSAGLYITNGDFTDWAYSTAKSLSYTPEGTVAVDGAFLGFGYQDVESEVQEEFRRHLPFILDLAKSADDPTEPESHLGNKARPITIDKFDKSFGDPQMIQATAQRKLGDVTLKFRINGGQVLTVPTSEWGGGSRYYGNDDVYYHRMRGFVSGTNPGDKVEVWASAGGKDSERFTYTAVSESDKPVLLLADEDWSGVQPNPEPLEGPQYLDQYKKILDAAGVQYDVYDISADRVAPSFFGTLSHYSHVVWYTGDDLITREPDQVPGSGMTRRAVDTQNRVRDFINEGGKLFYTGENAGFEFAALQAYNPFQNEEGEYCDTSTQCIQSQDDFLQYYLGANTYIQGAGNNPEDPDGKPFPITGFGGAFDTGPFNLQDDALASSLLVTSSIYDPAKYPLFADSGKAMAYQRPGGSPFDPHTGDWFIAGGTTDESYKRFQHEFDLTGKAAANLSFFTSFDTEADYDYMFVEIHTKGQDDWDTLADTSGNELTSTDTGSSCTEQNPDSSAWQDLHPFLAHYQTVSEDGTSCTSTGTSGSWNAMTGNSGGWKKFAADIPAKYLGKNVEISITMATDPATEGLGEWIDDFVFTADGAEVLNTSFETDLAGFTTPGPPPGTVSQATGWERAQSAPFVEGAATFTDETVYTGFGLEKVATDEGQTAIMKDVFEHLGAPKKPVFTAPVPVPEPPSGDGGNGGNNGGGNGGGGDNNGGGTPPAGETPRQAGLSQYRIGSQRLKTVRRRGLRVTVRCPDPDGCPFDLSLRIDRPTQRALKLGSRRVGRTRVTLKQGEAVVTVKLNKKTRRALKKAKRKSLRVVVVGVVPGAIEGSRFVNSVRLR
ncbi:MAG TPA: M14 family zinc carboxypeptidase [Solirubrobacteraceae bacterium]|jgi:murein tripeptide amidase MpaA